MYMMWELCVMCVGMIYWVNIGRVIFVVSGEQFMEVIGFNNVINFIFGGNCFEVFQGSQKDIEVLGFLLGWDKKVMEDLDWFWSIIKV